MYVCTQIGLHVSSFIYYTRIPRLPLPGLHVNLYHVRVVSRTRNSQLAFAVKCGCHKSWYAAPCELLTLPHLLLPPLPPLLMQNYGFQLKHASTFPFPFYFFYFLLPLLL